MELRLLGNGVAGVQLRQAWVTSCCAQAAADSPLPGPQRARGQTPEDISRLPQFSQDVVENLGDHTGGGRTWEPIRQDTRAGLKKGGFN